MRVAQKKTSTIVFFHSILCVLVAMVFINFSVQFNNHIIAKLISANIENNIDGSSELDFTAPSTSAEEHNEEGGNENKNNPHNKYEHLNNTDLQHNITAFSNSKNHFVMADLDEFSLEIPSPPPWS